MMGNYLFNLILATKAAGISLNCPPHDSGRLFGLPAGKAHSSNPSKTNLFSKARLKVILQRPFEVELRFGLIDQRNTIRLVGRHIP